MRKQLSPEAMTRLTAFCARLRVARDLDADIAAELLGHLEDKALEYLNGPGPVSEDDALSRVERDFGDPAALQFLLRDVHAPGRSWPRRLAVAVITTGLLETAALVPPLAVRDGNIALLAMACGGPTLTFALWGILARWKCLEADARSLWWHVASAGALAVGVVVSVAAVFGTQYLPPGPDAAGFVESGTFWTVVAFCAIASITVARMARGWIWMSWCCRGPAPRAATWGTALAWSAFWIPPPLVPGVWGTVPILTYLALVGLSAAFYAGTFLGGRAFVNAFSKTPRPITA